jgi:hypothetical protein
MGDRFSAVYVRTTREGLRSIASAVQKLAAEFRKPILPFGKPLDVTLWAARNPEVLADGWGLTLNTRARSAGTSTGAFLATFPAPDRNEAVRAFLDWCGDDPNFAMAGVASNVAGQSLYLFHNDTLCSSGSVEMRQGWAVRAEAYGLGGDEDLVSYADRTFSVGKRSLQAGEFSYEEPACDALARFAGQPRGTEDLYDRLLPPGAPETTVFELTSAGRPLAAIVERPWTPAADA